MLLRYFLSPRGRLSVGRYRAFLLWYFGGLVPSFVLLFFAFLAIGGGSISGILRKLDFPAAVFGGLAYTVGLLWPLIAATARRMHDIGLRNRDYFFMLSPLRTWGLGRDLLFKRGEEKTNIHGPDPGLFE